MKCARCGAPLLHSDDAEWLGIPIICEKCMKADEPINWPADDNESMRAARLKGGQAKAKNRKESVDV
jgi:hypothetical protein